MDLCESPDFKGRWVALDNVVFEPGSREPIEADVVDVDEDVASLCARMRAANQTACRVMHCLRTARSANANRSRT